MKNDFTVDVSKRNKRDFLKRISIPLGIALLLTGMETAAGVLFVCRGLSGSLEMTAYAWGVECLRFLTAACTFVFLWKALLDERPFSRTFTGCIRAIAVFQLLVAVVFPRLPGFATRFEIFRFGSVILLDGGFLSKALLLWVFSVILQEGFSMQKDLEEIL